MVTTDAAGGARAVSRCDLLARPPYSSADDMLFRAYLTPAHAAALETIAVWMREAGMTVHIDAAANLIGRYEGRDPAAPALLIGSHVDSVRDGGAYDGPLGVMLGIEAVALLAAEGRRLPFAIEVIAFGDEEGSRFPAAMLTSRVVAGTLERMPFDMADADGVTLGAALGLFSLRGHGGMRGAARPAGSTIAYLEAHIEQGPVLESEGRAIGTVTGIAAQHRYQVIVQGQAGHAGTSSMPLRRDALTAAAEIILAVERIARDAASDLVATVGKLEVAPGAPNVIPGRVTFTVDVRAGEADRRDAAAAAILAGIDEIARRRGVELTSALIHDLPASPSDPMLMDLLDEATAAAGQPVRRLVSGAGHDAMIMASLCPTVMLFLRCAGGISHNPAERVDPADAEIALAVMLGFIDRLGERFA